MFRANILHGYKRRAAYTWFYTSFCSFFSMVLIGACAAITHEPLIFPSLGPSALMFFARPLHRDSSPRHVLFGHAIGAGCGYFALAVTGLLSVPYTAPIGSHRVFAAAVALSLTALFMVLARSEHAPAGATTLIVSLGFLPKPMDFAVLMGAVAMLTGLAYAINRLFAIEYPAWFPVPRVVAHNAELLK